MRKGGDPDTHGSEEPLRLVIRRVRKRRAKKINSRGRRSGAILAAIPEL